MVEGLPDLAPQILVDTPTTDYIFGFPLKNWSPLFNTNPKRINYSN